MNHILELATQMILCLLIAAIIGAIIGYLIGRIGKCPDLEEKPLTEPVSETISAREEAPAPETTEHTEPTAAQKATRRLHDAGKAEATEATEAAAQAILHQDTEHFEGERPPLLPAPRNGLPDDLKEISGIGLKIEDMLHELGIFHFDQIARWTKENIKWIEQYLNFKGRVERENWVGQAKILSAGQQHRTQSNPDIDKKQ